METAIKKHKGRNTGGFTLIELAITIMIVAVLLGAGAAAFNQWENKRRHEITARNVEHVALSIAAYRALYGRYPCPAPLTAARTDNTYGFEVSCAKNAPDNGTVKVTSARGMVPAKDMNGDGTLEAAETRVVRIGSVPFRTLNFDEKFSIDAYGAKLTYAVTEVQARQGYAYDPYEGGITIYDENGNHLSSVPHANDFVVLSHGRGQVGAYSPEGARLSSCYTDTTEPDEENCNHDSVFRAAAFGSGPDDRHSDDVVTFEFPMNNSHYARNPLAPSSTDDIYNIKLGTVATDFAYDWYKRNPAYKEYSTDSKSVWQRIQDAKLWVGGDIRVDGQLQAQEFCPVDGGDGTGCFPPSSIGSTTGIMCNGQQLMVGIENATAVCRSGSVTIACPSPQVVTGFSNGSLQCGFLPCPATARTLCGETFNLPDSLHNATHGEFKAGFCRRSSFRCNNGTWQETGATGWCSKPSENHTSSCGVCKTGTIKYNREIVSVNGVCQIKKTWGSTNNCKNKKNCPGKDGSTTGSPPTTPPPDPPTTPSGGGGPSGGGVGPGGPGGAF